MTNVAFDAEVRISDGGQLFPGAERPGVFMMTNDFEVGGSERQFTTLARSLESNAFRVELGCIRRRGTLLEGFAGIPEFQTGGSFLSRRALSSYIALGRHLRSKQIAIAHAFDFYSNLMLIPTARLAGVPVVIGSQRQLGDLLSPLQFGVQAAAFGMCDSVVCNSRAAAARLTNQGLPESKVVIIPNGIPDSVFAEAVPAIPRTPEMLRIGLIARMNNPVKNHPVFLHSVARLAQKFSNFEVLLVGDGPLRPALERMAQRLGIDRRVRFLGERHDIPEVLASIDISVLPSFSESLSNSIIESMAAGVAVVATRVGGNPELISDGETGLLVPPDDEGKLAEALERFITEPALRLECSERARKLARANFSLAQSCRRFENLYETLLRAKGAWPSSQEDRPPVKAFTRPTRVAIVAASPRWIGGQGVQAELLIKSWQNDPDVEARFIPIDPQLPRGLAWVERVPVLRTIIRMPVYLRLLWKGIEDVDLVHIFSASYWSFLLAPTPAWLLARWRGKKTLINYHSGEARDHLRRFRTALSVLRRTDRLIVPSAYLVDVFREFGLKAIAVPNVVDLNQFAYRPRQPLRPLLICTRGFGIYYRVDLVVRAFERVKKEFPSARLALLGKGKQESAVRQLVGDLKLQNVEFTGPISRDEIGKYYDRADIFINASWLDNMPISILEAFASGTPVVSTAPEGIRYLVQHEQNGLLCAPGDWQALGDNVIRLLRDPELAARVARTAHTESSRYHWAQVRDQWLQVYRALHYGALATGKSESARELYAAVSYR